MFLVCSLKKTINFGHCVRFPSSSLELGYERIRFHALDAQHLTWNQHRLDECLCSFPQLPTVIVGICFEIVDPTHLHLH